LQKAGKQLYGIKWISAQNPTVRCNAEMIKIKPESKQQALGISKLFVSGALYTQSRLQVLRRK